MKKFSIKDIIFVKKRGFAGITHVLIAIFFIFIFLYLQIPQILQYQELIKNNWRITVLMFFILSGASLLPDLDNNRSTAYFQLGIFGKIINKLMFVTSKIATIFRMKNDYIPKTLHRCLWHTLLVPATLIYIFIKIPNYEDINYFQLFEQNGINALFIYWPLHISVILSLCCIHLSLVVLSVRLLKPFPKIVQQIISKLLLVALFLILFISSINEFKLFGLFIAFGYLIHIISDMFSELSAPLLWPIPIFWKRMWWWRPRSKRIFGRMKINDTGSKILNIILVTLNIFLFYLLFIHDRLMLLLENNL